MSVFDIERGLLADRAFMQHVRTHTHVGAHVEVDAHFFEGGCDVPACPLTDFRECGLLLDVPDLDAVPRVTVEYLDKTLGHLIGEDDIVICRVGVN